MPRLTFTSESVGRAVAVAKLVKPAIGKFSMKTVGDRLVVFSYDRRRWARSSVRAERVHDVADGYDSGEFFVAADRQALVHTDLETVTLSLGEKAVTLKAEGSGQVRNATLQRRAQDSRLARIPQPPSHDGAHRLNAAKLAELVHQASCSALIKETKTDEARKVNQVHFFPDESCAYANARGFLTVASMPGMKLDLSVVADDLPLVKSFCMKLGEGDVLVFQDPERLYLADDRMDSVLCLSRVATKKPSLPTIDSDGFSIEVRIDRAQFTKAMQWAHMTIEGTQRATFRARADSGQSGTMEILHGKQEMSTLPVTFARGSEFCGDFSYKVLSNIAHYLMGDVLVLKYGHGAAKFVLEVSEQTDSEVRARHFLQSMKER